jgi:hypothetical protein
MVVEPVAEVSAPADAGDAAVVEPLEESIPAADEATLDGTQVDSASKDKPQKGRA